MNEDIKKQLELISYLPKADLHCHIDGSIRPATILELAIKDGIDVPTKNLQDFKRYVQVDDDCQSLVDILKKFDYPLKVFNSKDNIKRITQEVLEDSAKESIRYIELRFAPFYGSGDITAEDRVKSVLEAMSEACEKFNIHSNLILCALRGEPIEKTIETVELASKYKNKGVVAIDLAGNEEAFPPQIYEKAFDLAKRKGLKITVHAGETGNPENIINSISILGANRIGHGFSAEKSNEVLDYIVKNKIPLEICIKSNIDTKGVDSLANHPISSLIKKGATVTLNTDDRSVFNVTLMDEYDRLLKTGVCFDETIKILKNGIEHSFAKNIVKKSILKEIDIKIKKLKKNYSHDQI